MFIFFNFINTIVNEVDDACDLIFELSLRKKNSAKLIGSLNQISEVTSVTYYVMEMFLKSIERNSYNIIRA